MELISREEVLNIINDVCNHALKEYDKKYHLPIRTITSTASKDIKELPSQWVEINEPPFGRAYQNDFVTFLSTETYEEVKRRLRRPKGKWIGIEYDGYADGLPVWELWECSECGIETKEETPFCAYCGADMSGARRVRRVGSCLCGR